MSNEMFFFTLVPKIDDFKSGYHCDKRYDQNKQEAHVL